METLILIAVAATALWFAAFVGLMATAPQETSTDKAADAERPHDPIGHSFVTAARTAIFVGLGAWALYATAETLGLLV